MSHPAVTCAIPATTSVAHVRENMAAATGRMPDEAMRRRIAAHRRRPLMSDWWTYSLSDFLLFAPRTYYRLFELYNDEVWPAQIAALVAGAAILALLERGGPLAGRLISVILAASWLVVAWAFHLQRYATINWAAVYFAAGFALQALLVLWSGTIGVGLTCGSMGRSRAEPVSPCSSSRWSGSLRSVGSSDGRGRRPRFSRLRRTPPLSPPSASC